MTILTIIKRAANYLILFLLTITLFTTEAYADIAVIVNPQSGVSTLTAKEIKAIFLGKKSSFPNGNKAAAVDQTINSASREIFLDKVLGKSEGKLTVYWARLVFSGKGSPPKSLDGDTAVKAFVAKTPGGIGYINAAKTDSSVIVVFKP